MRRLDSEILHSVINDELSDNSICKIIKIILEDVADVDEIIDKKDFWGKTPLHLAAERGLTKLVELLLDNGADMHAIIGADTFQSGRVMFTVKSYPFDGQTPVHVAVMEGHEDVVKLFIEKGANVYVKNKYGETLLNTASEYNRSKMVDLLQQHAAG